MKKFSLRFIVAVISFAAGVACVSLLLVSRYASIQTSQLQLAAVPAVPSDTLITLQRTGCYGQCPSYTLVVAGDGTVTFNATGYFVREKDTAYFKQSGVIMSKVSQEQVRQLISEFEKANYFSLKDSYVKSEECPKGIATDMPSAYTSIQIGGRRKGIAHYYGCMYEGKDYAVYPRELTELEERIDEIVSTAQWMR